MRINMYLGVLNMENKIVLKVGMKSVPNSVAGAISAYIKKGNVIEVVAMGPEAVNQANKAMIVAYGWLIQSGIHVSFTPSFADLEIDGRIKTAIRWTVKKEG